MTGWLQARMVSLIVKVWQRISFTIGINKQIIGDRFGRSEGGERRCDSSVFKIELEKRFLSLQVLQWHLAYS